MLNTETATQNPLVSIVDDDASVRNSTGRLVRSFGFRAEVFSSAREFLTYGHPATTACLLLDLRMPEIDGLELQRHLSDNHHRIPIVFITGNADVGDEFQAAKAGAVDFLRKPVSPNILADAIQTALRLHFDGGAKAPDLQLSE
jgi:two-component system response regulator FixJ